MRLIRISTVIIIISSHQENLPQSVVVKPVLAYVKVFCQHADRLEVHSTVLNGYDLVAIHKAKDVLD